MDRPLVTQNLVGGEDGIDDAGISISRLIPAPKGLFLEGTAQIYRGDSENVFASTRRSQLAGVAHLRAYADINEATNIDVGASYARGHSPFANAWNQLYGFDAMLRWKPLRRAIYHSFSARSEVIWTHTPVSIPGLISPFPQFAPATAVIKPAGFYISGEYQLGRRWFLGGRYDNSQRGACMPTNPPTTTTCNLNDFTLDPRLQNVLLRDTGGSVLLTYLPSEFSQLRAQLRRTSYGGSFTTNELLFQIMFSMGAHGAHPF